MESDEIEFSNECSYTKGKFFRDQIAGQNRAMKKLTCVMFFALGFMTVEIIGGILSNSLSILTDAAHQLSDVFGFALSIMAVNMSQRSATLKNTYGFYRAEIMGALATVFIIWALVLYIVYEAVLRIRHLDSFELEGKFMLITSVIGLLFNIANLLVLKFAFNEDEDEDELKEPPADATEAEKAKFRRM